MLTSASVLTCILPYARPERDCRGRLADELCGRHLGDQLLNQRQRHRDDLRQNHLLDQRQHLPDDLADDLLLRLRGTDAELLGTELLGAEWRVAVVATLT